MKHGTKDFSMNDVAIKVEGLSKVYRVGQLERYKALRDILADAMYAPFRAMGSILKPQKAKESTRRSPDNYIWALKDVNFEVKPGEVIGIIGPNGAGKTTLLKILSRITEPTEGTIDLYGRVGSLLEVGTGFHPELTGRENIYLNGAILGMKRNEIEDRFDEIVEFSGVGKFLETPVKRFSSGMYVRLAFSVAAHLFPEILLVDEVLAVGDAAFQEKCLGKMDEVASSGRTVLFVSHNMAAVRKLCSRVLWIDKGKLRAQGTADETIRAYLTSVRTSPRSDIENLAERSDRSGSGKVRAVSFIARSVGSENLTPQTGSDADFVISYSGSSDEPLSRMHVAIGVVDSYGVRVFACTTSMTSLRDFRDVPANGQIICRIKNLPLIPGEYWVDILLKDDHGLVDSIDKASNFEVIDGGKTGFAVIPTRRWGNVVVTHEWEWEPSSVEDKTHQEEIG